MTSKISVSEDFFWTKLSGGTQEFTILINAEIVGLRMAIHEESFVLYDRMH